jgi:hypothetical protein
VERHKLLDYLLSTTHPRGRTKAAFFRSLGFTADNWSDLVEALRRHISVGRITPCETTQYGTLYQVDGSLFSVANQPFSIRSIWLVKPGEQVPRFVTAYPLKTR